MLTELVVENLGVIDRAELNLGAGSSALTGETGAGKTLLVAALGSLAGDRSDRGMVRQGEEQARIEARFDLEPGHPVRPLLRTHDLLDEDGSEVVLTRTIGADGRSKARINGRLVTLTLLQEIGSSLVEIAGQNGGSRLGSPSAQRHLLDAFGEERTIELAALVAEGVGELSRLRAELAELTASERERARELDVTSAEIAEIEAVDPQPSESEELTNAAARLEHAETISSGLSAAVEWLKGEGGAGEALAAAGKEITSLSALDPGLTALAERLDQVAVELSDITEELSRANVPADPSALAATRERMSNLKRLTRKFGATEEDVLGYLQRAKERVLALESAGRNEQELVDDIRLAERRITGFAEELSARRKEAAAALEEKMIPLLAKLALPGARFEVAIRPHELYAGGLESIQFLIAANAGESPRPLSKVASGGELSRIALALRLLTTTGEASTLVFDEVDAGVGGEAALAVGDCLARLGHERGAQVLVVTHLPQVAAFADHQYRVTKTEKHERSSSMVELVEGDERLQELSRMLAGLPESERGREHARELLVLAGRQGRS